MGITKNKPTRPNLVKQAIDLTKLAAEARHAGKEKEALGYESQVQQLEWRAVSKTKVPYNVFVKHAHYEKFDTNKELWNQASRGAHADTGGKNTTARRAEKIEALLVAGQTAGKSGTAIAFEISSFVTMEEATHYLAVRNSIAELGNDAQLRELLKETGGDIETAKALAKARKVSWAPVYATPDDEATTNREDAQSDEEPISSTPNIDDEPKLEEPNASGAHAEPLELMDERVSITEDATGSASERHDDTNDMTSAAFGRNAADVSDEEAAPDEHSTGTAARVDTPVAAIADAAASAEVI